MDEEQTDGVRDRHNGTSIADAARWNRDGVGVEQSWSSLRTASEPVEQVSAPAHAGAGGEPRRRHAPGLDDETPPGGTPAVEPPLWREAARHAWTSAPPSQDTWTPEPVDLSPPAAAAPDPAPGDPPASDEVAADPRAAAATLPLGAGSGPSGTTWSDLPQRVPAEPDVPHVPEAGEVKTAPPAAAPQLARIADQLRRDDVPPEEGRTEGFDVDAVLDAVKDVAGVRAAALRTNPHGAHTLRLDLAEDADPVQVSRVVARLLQERMGLSAAPQQVSQQVPQQVPHPRTAPEGAADETPPTRHAGVVARHPVPPRSRSRPLAVTGTVPRVVIDEIQVNITGLEATVEVRLAAGRRYALGIARGPAIDSYVVRLAAVSAAKAIDELVREAGHPVAADQAPSRCFVEHTGVVPFGATEVAVVVVLLVCGGWVEQLAGSAVVDGDSRHAAVRATLGAVNRRLDALLAS